MFDGRQSGYGEANPKGFARRGGKLSGRRDLPSSDYSESLRELAGMASKMARQEEEGFIGVLKNSQVDDGSS